MRKLVSWLCPGLALALTGCPSFSTLQTARSLDKGQFQVTAAPEVVGGISTSSTTSTLAVPQLELAGRYGVTDNVDLGIKLWLLGAEFDSTISILKGGSLDLAVAPGIGYFGISASSGGTSAGFNALQLYLPLLLGVPFGDGHEFVFGPKLIPYFLLGGGGSGSSTTSASGFELYAGGVVGVSFKVGDNFRVMPEVNFFYPLFTSASSGGQSVSAFGGGQAVIFQGGVGLAFGGNEFAAHPAPAPAMAPAPYPAAPPPPPNTPTPPPPPPSG